MSLRKERPPSDEELRWEFDREHGLLDADENEYLAATGFRNAREAMEAIKAGKPLNSKKTEAEAMERKDMLIEALQEEVQKLQERVKCLEGQIKVNREIAEDNCAWGKEYGKYPTKEKTERYLNSNPLPKPLLNWILMSHLTNIRC